MLVSQWDYAENVDEPCMVVLGRYRDGTLAVRLVVAEDGSPMATVSSHLGEKQKLLASNEVYVKTYSENEGMDADLAVAGVLHPTGKYVDNGFARFPVMTVNPELLRKFEEQEATTKEVK